MNDGTLTTVGVKLWTALNSDAWRHREAASKAFLEYLESGDENPSGLPAKHEESPEKLFIASIMIAKICCYDKLLNVYFTGINILSKAIMPPICVGVPARRIKKEVTPFIKLLISKVEQLNDKAREKSQTALIGLFKNPAMDSATLVSELMEITKKGPKPDKAPERIILGRLELLLLLL